MKRLAGTIVVIAVVASVGCATHPVNRALDAQQDMLWDIVYILKSVRTSDDVQPTLKKIDAMMGRMQTKMAAAFGDPSDVRMPNAWERAHMKDQVKAMKPALAAMQKELARLSKLPWAAALVEKTKSLKWGNRVEG